MTNHDYNPPDHPLHFSNDPKQQRYSFVIAGIGIVIVLLLLVMLIR